jgi:hypothetical protein
MAASAPIARAPDSVRSVRVPAIENPNARSNDASRSLMLAAGSGACSPLSVAGAASLRMAGTIGDEILSMTRAFIRANRS